jgi:elongation factor Ts
MVTAEQIKELREKTGLSVMGCKKALEEANGDIEKAVEILKQQGAAFAENKSERALKAGIVDAYIHATKTVGSLVEVRCETDFVAKNEEFKNFAHEIAMHVAALKPTDINELLAQQFIKSQQITVGDYVKEKIQKFGENIEIAKIIHFEA